MALPKRKPNKASKLSSKTSKPSRLKEKTKSSKSPMSLKDRAKQKLKESRKSGFTAMREAKSERSFSNRWMSFFVRKGETKPVLFLTDDLVVVRIHTVKEYTQTGKEIYREYLCTEDDDCKGCNEIQAGNKAVRPAATNGYTLVLDIEGYEKDGKEFPWIVRPLSVNTSLSSVLEHRDLKEGLYLTMFDMTKLERGHSLDVIRDEDDEIQRFDSERELIKFLKSDEGNPDTAKMLKEALDKYGDFRTWLKEEILPEFLNPDNMRINSSSGDDDDDDENEYSTSKYSFRGKDKKKDKSKLSRRSRLR
jgi:hypothetical protein